MNKPMKTLHRITKTVNIDDLIARTKTSDKRSLNRGRPRIGMSEFEAEIVTILRKKKCPVMGIFREMSKDSLTRYKTYGAFLNAYKEHLLHK